MNTTQSPTPSSSQTPPPTPPASPPPTKTKKQMTLESLVLPTVFEIDTYRLTNVKIAELNNLQLKGTLQGKTVDDKYKLALATDLLFDDMIKTYRDLKVKHEEDLDRIITYHKEYNAIEKKLSAAVEYNYDLVQKADRLERENDALKQESAIEDNFDLVQKVDRLER